MVHNAKLTNPGSRRNADINLSYGCEKDPNTYCYRTIDGQLRLHRIALGYGWENQPFDCTKLSCYEKKGEGDMTSPTPSREELRDIYHECGNSITRTCKKIHKSQKTTKELLVKYGIIDMECNLLPEQTPPEPEGDQPNAAQEDQGTAENSIPPNKGTLKKGLLYRCVACKQLIPKSEGIMTLEGFFVCDRDSCRELDADCEASAKLNQDITVKDALMYELELREALNAEDDEPIPYLTVAEEKTVYLDNFKIQMIEAMISRYYAMVDATPVKYLLSMIKLTLELEVEI